MDKKTIVIFGLVIGVGLVLNILLLLANNSMQAAIPDITGLAIEKGFESETPLLERDIIEIDRNELSACCSFLNEDGEEDTCYVLKNYDCGFCSDFCS